MSEIRSGGHLHVEPPIHLAGCPYFHNKIRPELYSIFLIQDPLLKRSRKNPSLTQQARVGDKNFQKRQIIFGHSVLWVQTWDISQNCETVLVGSVPCTSSAPPPCSKQSQTACSVPCPLKLWKSGFKKLAHQAMSTKLPWQSALIHFFWSITQKKRIPNSPFLL